MNHRKLAAQKCSSPVRVGLCIILLVVCSSRNVHAQSVQFWLETDSHKSLGSWEYKISPNARKLIADQGWLRLGLRNTFSLAVRPWFTPEASLDGYYTLDPESSDIGEVRLWLATKFTYPKFLSAIHLDKPFVYARLEQRFLWYPEDDQNDQKTRLRLKGGGKFILNGSKVAEGTFYVPWYVEGFFNFNGEAFEHSASRSRVSLGVGYAFNRHWRTEFEYVIQGARNVVDDEVKRTDSIFQFKVDHYFD